jgi:hypothetical protein
MLLGGRWGRGSVWFVTMWYFSLFILILGPVFTSFVCRNFGFGGRGGMILMMELGVDPQARS